MSVDPSQIFQTRIPLAFADQIHHLTTGQTLGADTLSQSRDNIQNTAGIHLILRSLFCDPLERSTQQRISSQNRNILSVHDVIGGLSTTQIIVVHSRQVIMNQGHGVDHFQSDRSRHGDLFASSKHFAGRQTQDRSDTLATGHERITHGFANQFGFLFGALHTVFQRLGDLRLLGHDIFRQVKVSGSSDFEGRRRRGTSNIGHRRTEGFGSSQQSHGKERKAHDCCVL
mmetsp:Transcript_102712/g.296916  ORF Transcript_102712/g.296916 Transcript_102712/m.296916 type:complete len:228 (-) Transcript_102712:42-725(-)